MRGDQPILAPLVTLTTDFGTRDGYVAQMKGAILTINPDVRIIDVTHDVEPFSVIEGAFVLRGMIRYFPPGAIHTAVVDPGVGGSRRGIVIRTGRAFFVGPDNGLFSFILGPDPALWEARSIENPAFMLPEPHPTFHGRDIFAPTAALVSLGRNFDEIGAVVENPVKLTVPEPSATDSEIRGALIYADRFGNLTSNIDAERVKGKAPRIRAGNTEVKGISAYFDEVPHGRPLALINSFGFMEIAVNRGSAVRDLGLQPGDPVTVELDRE